MPRSGQPPQAKDVERRLRTEFAYVAVDPAEGNDRALALAAWIEARPASIFLGKHEAWLERARHLRMLPPGEAVGFTFGDDPSGPTMHFVLIPGDSIKFGYGSSEQEARDRPLLERCARVLESEVVLF